MVDLFFVEGEERREKNKSKSTKCSSKLFCIGTHDSLFVQTLSVTTDIAGERVQRSLCVYRGPIDR